MSSWLTYTAAPRNDISLDEFTERVGEAYQASPSKIQEELEPIGYREHGVVSERVSSSSGISSSDIQTLFERVYNSVSVLYLTQVSDTTDGVTIQIYEPTKSGKLGLVESRSGELIFEDRGEYDDRFDEHAAAVRTFEDTRMGTYSDEDHVTDLRVEYGARPLFHYI